MTANNAPKGEEREVKRTGGVTIDGAPVAYIIAWAAVIVVLSFVPIPVSLILGQGKPFPMSQAVYPLVGIMLGPWAGALAAGVGRLIGLASAPLTNTGVFSIVVAVVVAATGGILVEKKGNHWIIPLFLWVLAFSGYFGLASSRGIPLSLAVQSTWVNWLGAILWILPTRTLARDWIASKPLGRLTIGLALGSWIVNTSCYIVANALFYILFPLTVPEWQALTFLTPLEHLVRMVVGTALGVGVISGLRAIGLVKAAKAGY